jgi:hypothetical protein
MPAPRQNEPAWTRRAVIGTAALGLAAPRRAQAAGVADVTPFPPSERQVGIAYALWHQTADWQQGPHKVWGRPEIGYYRSDDPAVLTRHAEWLVDAGVDFAVLDWSNDIGMDIRRDGGPATQRFIETATVKLFDVWAGLPRSPSIVPMIGCPENAAAFTDGRLSAKADEVHDLIVANQGRYRLLQGYLGKPLLLVYVGTPSPIHDGLPAWLDGRFTIRFVTGFITQQPNLQGPQGISRYGYWSWEDRRVPTYTVFGGHPECMTVEAAWNGVNSPGRANGRTYLDQWRHAREVGPRFVLGGSFNGWWTDEQATPETSKDVEPSKEFGWKYMDIFKEQAALFKGGR